MKKLITLSLALVAFASCSKQTSFDELELFNITVDKGPVTMVLDNKVIGIDQGQNIQLKRFDYASISLVCQSECKVNINGDIYYSSSKIK